MITKMKYVLVQKSGDDEDRISIIDDPVALYNSGVYNQARGDKLFQIGQEVKIEVKIELAQGQTYRSPHPETFTLGPSRDQETWS
jgi:hypothetical protein